MKEFVARLLSDPKTVRKFVVAFVGAVAVAVSLGVLDKSWSNWLAIVISFLTSLGVYAAPNSEDKAE
jgi:hypothetical protein